MKLWLSGEIDSDVGGEKFGPAMRAVEIDINRQLSDFKNIDIGVKGWDCIAIIRGDESFKEIVKYSSKKLDMDFRLKIDHFLFKNGTDEDRKMLLREMLNRSLEILESKVDIKYANNIKILREKIFRLKGSASH